MGVDVSKAAVDARVAKRAEDRAITVGLLGGAGALVTIRLYSGTWMPLLLAGIVFGLTYAASRAVAKAYFTRVLPKQ